MEIIALLLTLFLYRPMSFESAKATETASELRKAREKMHDQEMHLSAVEKEKKSLVLKLKELESVLDRRPQVSGGRKGMSEISEKLENTIKNTTY